MPTSTSAIYFARSEAEAARFRRRKRVTGGAIAAVTAAASIIVLFMVVFLMGTIVREGYGSLSWEFLTQPPREGMTAGGIFPALVGTVFLVLIMTLVGLPLGILTGIYLSEYASKTSPLTRMVRLAVNNLAGVPSIVFGLFGLGFFIQFVGGSVDRFLGGGTLKWGQPNLLWASLTMALLTLPVVIVSVEEALKAVPDGYRQASLALGATKWTTILRAVLPAASNGILTGAILGISRGAGEVAPILFTGVAYFLPDLPGSPADQFMHLGYHIYVLATQSVDVEATKPLQFATTLTLLMLTFALNFAATYLRYRLRRRKR